MEPAVLTESSGFQGLNVTLYSVSEGGETAIGIYLVLLGWLSWIGNGIVIVIMAKQRKSLEPQEFLILNLAVSDASISIFGYSRGILEVFNVFRDNSFLINSIWTCRVDGFLILLFGLISINTLTAISVIRYIKGCQPQHAHRIDKRSAALVIAAIWLNSLFWSGSPLLGWGSYKGRKYGTCEIDWVQALVSLPYKLYVISVFLFNFFVPVVIIVFSYVSIIRTVNSSHRSTRGSQVSDRQRQMERSVTGVSFMLCTAFLVAWSPYAVISMWSACGYQVPPLTSIMASLFAKSASFYNPLIYISMSSRFRQDLQALFGCLQPDTPLSASPPQQRPLEVERVQIKVEQPEKPAQPDNLDSGVEVGHNDSTHDSGQEEGAEPEAQAHSPAAAERTAFPRKQSDSGRL
ncbi:opsin 6, group member b [Megalops cyprinoides]|uniref:opsin 6, group member b n=1 Tax=Megalops cyprinoides TaxID=118141 RepID=UPI001863B2F1|nr:opsin 6, group member b [Megalops cyprinoides]